MSNLYGYDMAGNYVADAPTSDGWSNLLTDVIKGYTTIETAKQQAKTAQAQQQVALYGPTGYTYPASYTGLTTGVTSMLPVLAVGAGVLALLYFAFKDSK